MSEGQTRRYDSPLRREQLAETRERIIDSGAELVHEKASWDWSGLTVRAVAARAGVHERTVHRHFSTERELRAAIAQKLLVESGVSIAGLRLSDVPAQVGQLFGYLESFAPSHGHVVDAVDDIDMQRRAGFLAAVASEDTKLTDAQRRGVAGVIDVLIGVDAYQRLVNGWGLGATEAAQAVTWVVELISADVRDGGGPS